MDVPHLRSLRLNYCKADISQLDEIFSVYQKAIITMENAGIHQWDEIYPAKEHLAEDIQKNQMYIGKEGQNIVVCFTLSEECDEEYKNGEWKYPDAKFTVIHRLCVNPEYQNHGISAKTLEYIENLCKSQGYDSIRLDCYTLNPYSQKLYNKAGYSVTGYADWRKGRFELREKKL